MFSVDLRYSKDISKDIFSINYTALARDVCKILTNIKSIIMLLVPDPTSYWASLVANRRYIEIEMKSPESSGWRTSQHKYSAHNLDYVPTSQPCDSDKPNTDNRDFVFSIWQPSHEKDIEVVDFSERWVLSSLVDIGNATEANSSGPGQRDRINASEWKDWATCPYCRREAASCFAQKPVLESPNARPATSSESHREEAGTWRKDCRTCRTLRKTCLFCKT